jgi:extradiol dioxygenase family protein
MSGMRESGDAFHLAIPALDLDEAYEFYVSGLGCKLARRYTDRITLDFFGDQVVCHLSETAEPQNGLYPRHFGVTFRDKTDWDRLCRLAEVRGLQFFAKPFQRFEGMVEEHFSFVLEDPSHNLLEFKHYADPRMMY